MLSSFLKAVGSGLLDTVFKYVGLWTQKEQKRQADYKARARKGKLRSSRQSRHAEREIAREARDSRDDAPTPEKWNAGALVLLVVLVTGCTRTVYVESRLPVLDAPDRPHVPTQPAEWTEREQTLKDYALQLESLVEQYNERAIRHNVEHGYRTPDSEGNHHDASGSSTSTD